MIPHTSNEIWTLVQVNIQSYYEIPTQNDTSNLCLCNGWYLYGLDCNIKKLLLKN